MVNQVNEQQVVEYRQTFNTFTKQWCGPKRKVYDKEKDKDVWRPIDNLKHVVNKRDGIGYALWRLRTRMLKLKCVTHNQTVWDCPKIRPVQVGVYTIYYLTCKRFKHSISGVM